MRWRVILSLPLGGPDNMAMDDALMARARQSGESVLRVYSWAQPVLSLGRNQPARDIYDLGTLAASGIDVVRRPTGGRALLHHREITYSVTAPVDPSLGLAETCHQINLLLVRALGTLGIAAAIARPTSAALQPSERPCFAEPAAGEIVVEGRKLVGSAQWRDDGALLQHGSVIVHDDQRRIPSLMRAPSQASPSPATMSELLGRAVEPAEFAEVLFRMLRDTVDSSATSLSADEVQSLATDTYVDRYRDPSWTWRR
ncbi:MAG: biotin/lipoate protein ligase [Gemmatimonadetes bacterium]|nr:biotin/lipoate protein ligase [Gemmatimonadota bacterium]